MANIFKPPIYAVSPRKKPSIFLAGSIEIGIAEDWQEKVTKVLANYNIDIYNPRRDDWDSSWKQSIDNYKFREQVEWELDHLDAATVIFMYFAPGTKSPISLLELGLYASKGNLLVVCPDDFWRKGNVDIVCARYNIDVYNNLDVALSDLVLELDLNNLKEANET